MTGDPDDDGRAGDHARALIAALGSSALPQPSGEHPALGWRRAGLMDVTGRADGPGLVCPVPLTCAADGALAALAALAPDARLPASGALLLGERARLLGLRRNGPVSPNGSCRLLAARDAHVAINLPRPDDWELVPALFGDAFDASWDSIAARCADMDAGELVTRGSELGMAVAAALPAAVPALPFSIEQAGAKVDRRRAHPVVVDLSSLWAGPLAGALLAMAGARVTKVESKQRPDGTRFGSPAFFALLNGGKRQLALDFSDKADLAHLRRLIEAADIVIESTRPRALRQLGIDAHAHAASGKTWVSITAHGREGAAANRIGFGDDAAIAGGLGAAMRASWGQPLFAGDAIADPLTGLTAALAGWGVWQAGGGAIVSLALAKVVAHACHLGTATPGELAGWQALAEADRQAPYALRSGG